MRERIPVVLEKDGKAMHFRSIMDAAEHIGVKRSQVSTALRKERKIAGYTVTKDTQKPSFLFAPSNKDDTHRVKELFTRKPFSATGMWKEDAGRGDE